MGDYKLEMINDSTNEFYIEFHGPKDSTCSSAHSLTAFQVLYSSKFSVVPSFATRPVRGGALENPRRASGSISL